MKTYRRILIPMSHDGRGEILLQRAAALLPARRGELMVVRVLDTRTGFESDGPAGTLPGEREARRIPQVRRQLDRMLARHDLSWAEARVVCGAPSPAMVDIIRDWQPDLVMTCGRWAPEAWVQDSPSPSPDILTVNCHGLFTRLGQVFGAAAHGHA